VGTAFDRLAARSGPPLVSRFAQGIAVAVERGTPLADVLHAQAADVREAGRRELIEVAARKEVFMMVPVVFLVLPVTILFAFWPGVVGLHRNDRGDVPGWVLITVMTAGLVMAIWGVAEGQLQSMLTNALNQVK
jgi:hypothetical protein